MLFNLLFSLTGLRYENPSNGGFSQEWVGLGWFPDGMGLARSHGTVQDD
jgi:hypothetical protein